MENLAPRPGDLEPIETASRDEISALQLKRLQWSLAHAYENVPLFKQRFDAKGVHPSDLKQLADLSKFPFTTKSDLRDNYPFGLFAVPREKISRIHASSGTTGKPTVVGYTANDIEMWAQLVARSIKASGGVLVTSSILPTDTVFSQVGSARITARRKWVARWCLFQGA